MNTPQHLYSGSSEEDDKKESKGAYSEEEDMFNFSTEVDPAASLNFLLRGSNQKGGKEEEECMEEVDDEIPDLPGLGSSALDKIEEDSSGSENKEDSGSGSKEDSGSEYKFGVYGTTPPRPSSRVRKKAKHKTGKNLSSEARVIASPSKTEPHKNRPHSVGYFTLPSTSEDSQPSGKPDSQSYLRRHTIHDINIKLEKMMSKRERRQQQRILSPSHGSDDGAAKSNKKSKKIQRKKDRDNKTDFLQQPNISPVPSISRAVSTGSSEIKFGTESTDFYPRDRSVTESLNPDIYRRISQIEAIHGKREARLRRTNSDAQLLGTMNTTRERRCPPDRKQFYRQFIKSIKFYGINSNRLETPAAPSLPRFHSENLAASNPFSPLMDKLWLELQAHLKDRTIEQHEEWLFFNQRNVDSILNKIIHFSFNVDCTQNVTSLCVPFSREGYEQLPSSSSTPTLGSLKRGESLNLSSEVRANGRPTLLQAKSEPLAATSVGLEEVQQCLHWERSSEDNSSNQDPPETSTCKVHHEDYLSLLQRKALRMVNEVLKQLDDVEALFMNHKKMGDEHPKYRTLYFKRRVCALILWYKVTHGLADNLCRLTNWLGREIALPEVCFDPPIVVRNNSAPDQSSNMRISLPSRSSTDTLVPSNSTNRFMQGCASPSDIPKSPLALNSFPRFSVGSPAEGDGFIKQQDSKVSHQTLSSSFGFSFTNPQQSLSSKHESYRDFVSIAMKRKGIAFIMKRLKEFIFPILGLAKYALNTPKEAEVIDPYEECLEEERKPLLKNAEHFVSPGVLNPFDSETHEIPTALFERSTSMDPQNWMTEFRSMNLPLFSLQYIRVIHVPLDVMQECLKLQVELGNDLQTPSPHSVKQLADECREILKYAIEIRVFYRDNIESILVNNPSKTEQVESDMEAFENDMKNVLKVYFHYLKTWVTLSSGHILEEEWRKIKSICRSIRGGEAEAGRRFCDMVTQLLESMRDDLLQRMDDYRSEINERRSEMDSRDLRELLSHSCRKFKELFVGIRERANRVLGFAKILRKDLEIAADFRIMTNIPELFSILKASDHVRVVLRHQKLDKMIFVPESTSEDPDEIQQLLNISSAHGSPDSHYIIESYILLVNVNVSESQSAWSGKTIEIHPSAETTINLSELQVDSLKMVVQSSSHLKECRNSFLRAVGKAVSLTNERTSSHETVADRINDLKAEACKLAKCLMKTASEVMEDLSTDDVSIADDQSSSYQSTMHACFNLGFEYVREVFRLLGDDIAYRELGEQALDYAIVWIHFVLDKCDRGRGTRPRWATMGLEFLMVACAPTTLASITQSRFENVKKLMNKCVDHVIGEAPSTTGTVIRPGDSSTFSRISLLNKKSWSKPKKLPFGAMGFSFTGLSHLEDDEDTTSVYKIPQSKFHEKRDSSLILGNLMLEEPPTVAMFDPSRCDTAARVCVMDNMGTEGTDGVDFHPMGLAYVRQQSPLNTIPNKSPPTSTDSLEHAYSSGVDSPPNQSSTSDLTIAAYTPSYPPCPRQMHSIPATPINVERMDSNVSTGSASRYYSHSYQRSPSSVSSPLSRSDSGSSTNGVDKSKRILDEINIIEINREKKLRNEKLIGHVSKQQTSLRSDVANLSNLKQTNFKWQRGRKLGEGRFGKVYECLNLTTGDINAVKQLSIQEKDTGAIQKIIDEISNFQRLRNDYVVKFYGVEVHHNELYMFMEYCNEGTLWTIAQQGLTEEMTRHYTRDILKAVDAMHTSGIVHRDIKGANIFLSSNGSIKLGDFGLSVQLKNYNMTMPNEIKQQAGTVPYMAPEVILKREMGRPMDIWSVGCVVIEMATGKLPWAEYDNQFTIMFKLGLGDRPPVIPHSALSDEGHRFLHKCFTVDVQKRPTAIELISDPFVMVSD